MLHVRDHNQETISLGLSKAKAINKPNTNSLNKSTFTKHKTKTHRFPQTFYNPKPRETL